MVEYSGGCQCGAVRFHVTGTLDDASICHCRMCQKAFGAYYAPLVSTRGAALVWTRGTPARYRSSNLVARGFCAQCGTPLTYEAPDGVALAAGAFDDPAALPRTSSTASKADCHSQIPCTPCRRAVPRRTSPRRRSSRASCPSSIPTTTLPPGRPGAADRPPTRAS